MKKRILIVLAVGVFLSCVCTAYAQDDAKKDKFGLIDVLKNPVKIILAPIEGGGFVDLIFEPVEKVLEPVLYKGEIVSTPSRTPEYKFNLTKNVGVITAEDIENADTTYTQQILPYEPGVVMSGCMNNAKDSFVDMRGFGEAGLMNTLVLVDSRRTNQVDLSGPDFSQIDPRSVDRIEIVRGGGSVLYGDNATGGVINIITKRGKGKPKLEYVQEIGSYLYKKEYFSASGGHEFLDYFFNYSYQDSDGYRVNNAYEANDIFSAFTLKPADLVEVDISGGYHRDWYGQPGALYDGNIQSDGREGSRFPDSKAKTEDWFLTANPIFSGDIFGLETVISSLMSLRSRRSNSLSVGFNNYETNHHIATAEIKPKCEISSSFLDDSVENKLVTGMDYFYARDRVLSGDITFAKSQVDIIKETFGIYGVDNVLIDKRFLLNGGVRGEWAKYIFDQFEPAKTYNTLSPEELALEAGAGYKYNERSQVYVNYSRSYRLPATDEFYQSAYEAFDWNTWSVRVFPEVLRSDLKPQRGNNYEVGIKDNSFGPLEMDASYYLMDISKEIYYDPITFQNENYGKTIHHGLELKAQANILDKIKCFFSYTFQKAFFVGGKFASKTIPMVPTNMMSGGFDFKPIEPLDVNFAVNYLGARFVASDQINELSKLESHTTMDLGVSYKFGGAKVFFKINNLFNEKYFSNGTKNWQGNIAFYPATERNYVFGASLEF